MLQTKKVHFKEEIIEAYGYGAGVVPFAYKPDGEVVLLLGRERFGYWRGASRWSGFEGSRKANEKMIDTAQREFTEETMNVLALPRSGLSNADARIVLRVVHPRYPERYHATYLVPVEWDQDIPRKFEDTRNSVEYTERLLQEWRFTRPDEMRGMRWVRELEKEPLCVTARAKDLHPRAGWEECTQERGSFTRTFEGSDAARIREWLAVQTKLQRAVRMYPHPCIQNKDWGDIHF